MLVLRVPTITVQCNVFVIYEVIFGLIFFIYIYIVSCLYTFHILEAVLIFFFVLKLYCAYRTVVQLCSLTEEGHTAKCSGCKSRFLQTGHRTQKHSSMRPISL